LRAAPVKELPIEELPIVDFRLTIEGRERPVISSRWRFSLNTENQ
jgi:hypothetical protein